MNKRIKKFWYFKKKNKKKGSIIDRLFKPKKKWVHLDPERQNNIKDSEFFKKRNALLAKSLNPFFKKFNFNVSENEIAKLIKKYDLIFKKNQIKNNEGGIGYNKGLYLFCFSSLINPNLIIESRVWKGNSTYILEKTLSKKDKMICFDLDFSKLIYKSKVAKYVNVDLEKFYHINKFSKKEKTFAFFDDHYPQSERLIFCIKNNIKFIAFDDDYSHLTIHSDGFPPIPTISMVINENKLPNKFSWNSFSREGYASFNVNKLKKLLIKDYLYLTAPDLFELTGYYNQSPLSFLVKKN